MAARVTAWSVVLLGAAMLAAGAALAFYSWITIFGLQLVGYNAISQVDSVRGSQGGIWAGLWTLGSGLVVFIVGVVLALILPRIADLRSAQPKLPHERVTVSGWTRGALLRLLVAVCLIFPTVATVYELFKDNYTAAGLTIAICAVLTLTLYVASLAGSARPGQNHEQE